MFPFESLNVSRNMSISVMNKSKESRNSLSREKNITYIDLISKMDMYNFMYKNFKNEIWNNDTYISYLCRRCKLFK